MMNNYSTADFETAYKMNVIVGAIFLALFIAVAVLSMIPGFDNVIFSLIGAK